MTLEDSRARLVQRADDHRHEHEHLATMTTGRGLRRRIAHHQRAEADFRLAAAVLDAFPKMLESLIRACESVDAGETDHDPSCAQEQDNVVAAHEENRPLTDCSCWVSSARDALRAAREAVKP